MIFSMHMERLSSMRKLTYIGSFQTFGLKIPFHIYNLLMMSKSFFVSYIYQYLTSWKLKSKKNLSIKNSKYTEYKYHLWKKPL
jgi:hypothetical protein